LKALVRKSSPIAMVKKEEPAEPQVCFFCLSSYLRLMVFGYSPLRAIETTHVDNPLGLSPMHFSCGEHWLSDQPGLLPVLLLSDRQAQDSCYPWKVGVMHSAGCINMCPLGLRSHVTMTICESVVYKLPKSMLTTVVQGPAWGGVLAGASPPGPGTEAVLQEAKPRLSDIQAEQERVRESCSRSFGAAGSSPSSIGRDGFATFLQWYAKHTQLVLRMTVCQIWPDSIGLWQC